MSIIDRLLGNAAEMTPAAAQKSLEPILIQGETVIMAFRVTRDLFVFTSRRVIFVDKQGVTGRKVEFHSIPYKAITQFSVENAGTFDVEAEMKIWVSGQATPIAKTLAKGSDVAGIQRALATGIFA